MKNKNIPGKQLPIHKFIALGGDPKDYEGMKETKKQESKEVEN